jgi:hypothetical protein
MNRSSHKLSLVFRPGEPFEIEFTRDETRNVWLIAVNGVGLSSSGEFPANFHTDKRSAREFARDFTVMLWPTSSAADIARQHARAAKRQKGKLQ